MRHLRSCFIGMTLVCFVLFISLPMVAASDRVDVVVRGGLLIDGSGGSPRIADLAIRNGRIVAIGSLRDIRAEEVLDAEGMVVCPGFIDLHSHADRGILEFRDAENYIRQGVTTLVCGNCGSSPTDIGRFTASVREGGVKPNIAILIGHGSIRQQVMGRVNAAPDAAQLAKMKQLVKRAMRDGAIGMSTSLRYGAGAYASTEEIIELARQVARFDGLYATHMRDEGTQILQAVEESLRIGEESGVPVHISHHKISSASVFGLTRLTLARIDQARAAGHDVTLDQYPYAAGSGGMSLYVPQWSLSGGMESFLHRLEQPELRERIVREVDDLLLRKIYEAGQDPGNLQQTRVALSRIRVARAKHDESLEGKTLTDILQLRQLPVTLENGRELLIELISEGVVGINHTLEGRPGGDVDRVMRHPQTCIASDGSVFAFGTGSPHPRSYGCFPRALRVYVRQRGVLELHQAIHKMSGLPASRLGWTERGVLRVGNHADVVVFDPESVADHATFVEPHQYSTGIRDVLVAGQFVLKSGEMTTHRPGQPVTLGFRRRSPPKMGRGGG